MTNRTMTSDGYWRQTRRPIYSLIFLLPLMVVYETGVLFIGSADHEYIRNGADVLVKTLLYSLGVKGFFLSSGLFVVVILIVMQIRSRSPWRVKTAYIATMFVECLFYPFLLILFSILLTGIILRNSLEGGNINIFAQVILSLGAGVYEEFVFRLLLIGFFSAILGVFLSLSKRWSMIVAAILAAAIFSLCHYMGPLGDTFEVPSFLYRTCAGLVLAAIYITRGFGIAAGTHAAYDILVTFIQGNLQ